MTKGKTSKHVCSKDGRTFKSAAALNQHRSDAHSGPVAQPRASRRVPHAGNGRGKSQSVANVGFGDERAALERILADEFGCSEEGAKYVAVVAHPSGSSGRDFAGLPDATTGASVTFDGRTNAILKAPAPAATKTLLSWDATIMSVPFVDKAFLYITSGTHTDGSVLPPVMLTSAGAWNSPELQGNFSEIRTVAKGMTSHLIANSTNNQGMLVGAQFIPELIVTSVDVSKDEQLTLVLGNLDAIVARCPGAIVHEAYKGCTTSSKACEPTNRYTPVRQDDVSTTYSLAGSPQTTLLSDVICEDFMPLSTAVHQYTGMSPAVSLQVSTNTLVEARAILGSIVSTFASSSPILDRASLDAATIIAQVTPDAYMASANDLGSMVMAAWGALVTYGVPVARAYASTGGPGAIQLGAAASGISFINNIAGGVAPADPGAGSMRSLLPARNNLPAPRRRRR